MIDSIVCEDVSELTYGSDRNVIVQCPICNEHRLKVYKKIFKHGHTICRECLYKVSKNEMIGKKFGELTVISIADQKLLVRCSCGVTKEIRAGNLRSGSTISCGHVQRELASERMKNAVGELNPNWKPEKSDSSRRTRNYDSNHHYWQKAIKERDGCCVNCGATEKLVAHHLNGYKWFKEQRYSLDNGVTLCSECHNKYHVWMGGFWIKSTIESFKEWFNDN